MSLTSISFFIFFAILLTVYYVVPKRFQWIVLLIASLVFYIWFNWQFMFFILFTTVSVYFAARYFTSVNKNQKDLFEHYGKLSKTDSAAKVVIKHKRKLVALPVAEAKKIVKEQNKKSKKRVFVLTLLINLGILVAVKYLDFLIDNLNGILSWFSSLSVPSANIFHVLGISFYTFLTIAYLIDVYWGKIDSEKNIFKFALFTTYFPKIIQGPIPRYNEMGDLFKEHKLDYKNFTNGLKRIAWGLFKKLVIADCLIVVMNAVFISNIDPNGLQALLAILASLVWDYADFSGYMDIAIGMSMCMGIKLPENFCRPLFARTIEDYWRRWHITLGTWFKDYIFYPLSTSKFVIKLGKVSKKIFGNSAGKLMPAVFCLLIVWLTTGIWHGASWNYVLWGLYYGIIIILGVLFSPLFKKLFAKLKINTQNIFFKIFQHIRTIFLLCVGRIIFFSPTLDRAWLIFKRPFEIFNFNYKFHSIMDLGVDAAKLAAVGIAFLILIVVDLIQEIKPKTSFCDKLSKRPLLLRWSIYVILVVIILIFGYYGGSTGGAFGYAGF